MGALASGDAVSSAFVAALELCMMCQSTFVPFRGVGIVCSVAKPGGALRIKALGCALCNRAGGAYFTKAGGAFFAVTKDIAFAAGGEWLNALWLAS